MTAAIFGAMDRPADTSVLAPASDDIALLDAYSRTVIDTLERTRAGVVSLRVRRRKGGPWPAGEGAGSGFLFTPDGYVITNSHVIEQADHVAATLEDGSEQAAEIVGHDIAEQEIAALQLGADRFDRHAEPLIVRLQEAERLHQ